MAITIIITLCILLLFAYLFDITSSITKIPSVILLLTLGIISRQISNYLGVNIPNLSPILPVLGTIGLILIVLEGSLELDIDKSKIPLIGKSSLMAVFPMVLQSLLLAYALYFIAGVDFKIALANTIPLSIISSAIAIPSAGNLISRNKEFITYESSLSDIFGVIFFNFITLNDNVGGQSIGQFLFELVLMLLISFASTLTLSIFLHKIKHRIKFAPIILFIILIYAISKIYHLPALIFILLFGLFLNNIEKLRGFKIIQQFHPINFSKEVHKFSELTIEFAFLIRALFFLLFGYLINLQDIINTQSLIWSSGIVMAIIGLRFVFLKFFKLTIRPLLFIAPRGLITILLFLSIPTGQSIPIVNQSLIIQVILLTALFMMFGLMNHHKKEEAEQSFTDSIQEL